MANIRNSIYQIRKDIPRRKRKSLGSKMIAYMRANHTLEKQLDWKLMYVSKDTDTKGNKSFNKYEFSSYREINFIADKELRKELGTLAYIAEVHHDNQFGFVTDRSIFDVIPKGFNCINKSISFDLEKAFDQISIDDVEQIFRYVFHINPNTAKTLANTFRTTDKSNKIAQGHPMSPLMFNIASYALIKRLSNIKGISTRMYADDITIFTNVNFVSFRFLKFIKKIFASERWTVNLSKTKYFKGYHPHLGLVFTKHGLQPQNIQKRIKALFYLEDNVQVVRGHLNWINKGTHRETYKPVIESLETLLRKYKLEYFLSYITKSRKSPLKT